MWLMTLSRSSAIHADVHLKTALLWAAKGPLEMEETRWQEKSSSTLFSMKDATPARWKKTAALLWGVAAVLRTAEACCPAPMILFEIQSRIDSPLPATAGWVPPGALGAEVCCQEAVWLTQFSIHNMLDVGLRETPPLPWVAAGCEGAPQVY